VNSNSVSLHIRRGDYVDNKYFAQIPLEYYYNSIELIENKFPNSSYYVFSDNLNWVKNNFKTNVNLHFVDANDSSTDFMELYLMSKCNHNIIANSTFSWWGAWLNKNPDKIVIAPKVWFGDKTAQENYKNGQHVPNNWIKM
ncbi:MAG: alpha-1,2-fucosyltransferase, partial [Bacteroidetes bacterium]|nr:alpha-1,2-fucosyltransferase [Bacteroidota bacterium]